MFQNEWMKEDAHWGGEDLRSTGSCLDLKMDSWKSESSYSNLYSNGKVASMPPPFVSPSTRCCKNLKQHSSRHHLLQIHISLTFRCWVPGSELDPVSPPSGAAVPAVGRAALEPGFVETTTNRSIYRMKKEREQEMEVEKAYFVQIHRVLTLFIVVAAGHGTVNKWFQ